MMKTYIKAFLTLLVAGILVTSCKKDNINGDASTLIKGSYIKLDSTINTNLDFSNDAATVSISVSEVGSTIASVNVYLATGSNRTDSTAWAFIKNVPYTGSSTVLKVSTAEIAAALAPDTIVPGTQYALENEVITTDGRKYSDANTPTAFSSQPAYKFAFYWPATAVCAFDQAATVGTYEVVQDDWVDYLPGDQIVVKAGPGQNQINFQGYPSPAAGHNTANTIVDVDPATGTATISKQATGDYGGTSAEVEGTGFVFSCTGNINLTMSIYYGGPPPYTGQTFKLKKI